jgi:CRP/FNR family transcriptional regulator, anaerobic regulatory protein
MNVCTRPLAELVTSQAPPTCIACAMYDLGICSAVSSAWALLNVQQSSHTVPARRIVFREQELAEVVPVICEGWAASIAMLSDGNRQILSFLLPGDLVSTALLFSGRSFGSVEAITEVRYRTFKRTELKASLLKNPDFFERFSKAWLEEKARSDQLIADLGRRTAEERIARLILGLQERLARRGLVRSETTDMEFPLRQHHIADATGLTPVHVSKVLSEFRRSGILKISDRSLTILDPIRFRRIALMR